MAELRYLTGYPPPLIEQVAALRDQGRLGDWLQQRYPDGAHDIQSDRALYDYAQALKQRGLKNTPPKCCTTASNTRCAARWAPTPAPPACKAAN